LDQQFSRVKPLIDSWPQFFSKRVSSGPLTLIHGDFHFGNIFLDNDKILVIDWASSKVSIPSYDIAYCLAKAGTENRIERDTNILKIYYDRLVELGIQGYSMKDCFADFRLSLILMWFQSLLQESEKWFRKNEETVKEWGSYEMGLEKFCCG